VKVPIPLFGSSLKVQPFLHPERCARVPDGAIGWCAETSTNFGAKHPLTQSGELIVLSFKPRSVAGAFSFRVVAIALPV